MRHLIKIVLIAFVTFNSFSQQSGEKYYNLEDCLRIAKEKNLNLQLVNNRVSAAEAELRNAFGDYLPSANFSMGYTRTLNVEGPSRFNLGGTILTFPGADPDAFSMHGFVAYNLFDGFNREANYNRADKNLESVELLTSQVYEDVKLDIYNNYIEVIKNYQIIKIRKENITQSRKQLESIQAKYEAGVLPIGSVYAQEAELGNLEMELVTAENQLDVAKANLLAIMGLDPAAKAEFYEMSLPTNVTDQDRLEFYNTTGNLPKIIQTALSSRLDYKAQISTYESAEQQVRMARSMYYPKVDATAGWRWNNSEFTDFSENGRSYVALNLSLPIFQNFRPGNQIESAKLQYKQREIEMKTKEQQIKNEVQTAYLNLQAAEKQLEISQRSIRASKQNYESAKERFNVGAASITDLILANYQYISAEVTRINSVYNYIAAQKQLLHRMGRL